MSLRQQLESQFHVSTSLWCLVPTVAASRSGFDPDRITVGERLRPKED